MVIVVDKRDKPVYVKEKKPSKAQLERKRKSDEHYQKAIKVPQLLEILDKELKTCPCSCFAENLGLGDYGIYMSSFLQYLFSLFSKKYSRNPCIGGINIHPKSSSLEDNIHIYNPIAFPVDVAKRIASQYEKIKGREMQVVKRWNIEYYPQY